MALAEGLTCFGPADGAPEWLVSGVWLCAGESHYLATSSVQVLADGYVARPLTICSEDELASQVAAEVPDVAARLLGRGSAIELPPATEAPSHPQSLEPWSGPYSASVLLRVSERCETIDRVACALLFIDQDDRLLLVGTDVSTLAMVISEDPELIDRYRASCEELSPAEYLALV